jgi:hypothetical protein
MTSTPRPPAMGARAFLRFGLAGIAAEMLLIAIPASIAPSWFFHWFLFGRGWAGAIGPYNSHYVLDLGYTYLGLGAVVAWAAVRLGRELCRAALVGSILGNLPHVLFHFFHAHAISFWDNVAQDGLLVATVVMAVVCLRVISVSPEAAELPTATQLSRTAEPAQLATTGTGDRH